VHVVNAACYADDVFLVVVQATIARRDTLLALCDLVADVQPDIAVKLLRCVKHLTRDPSMLLPLYVRHILAASRCAL